MACCGARIGCPQARSSAVRSLLQATRRCNHAHSRAATSGPLVGKIRGASRVRGLYYPLHFPPSSSLYFSPPRPATPRHFQSCNTNRTLRISHFNRHQLFLAAMFTATRALRQASVQGHVPLIKFLGPRTIPGTSAFTTTYLLETLTLTYILFSQRRPHSQASPCFSYRQASRGLHLRWPPRLVQLLP